VGGAGAGEGVQVREGACEEGVETLQRHVTPTWS
jgi:hypothetical protein